jgi:CRP-like cAMP-binding protein
MLWVIRGDVRLVRRARNGAELVLQRAPSGFVAEASLDSSEYHCDAVAGAESALLSFPMEPFRAALREDDAFRGFWMRRLAKEVRTLRMQCERLALRSAAERIEHYIECEGNNGRLELRPTRKAWASELGLSHEALYRALGELQRSGRLQATKRKDGLLLTLTPHRKTRTLQSQKNGSQAFGSSS